VHATADAQTSRDSISVRKIQKQLHLPDATARLLLTIEQERSQRVDSLNKNKSVSITDRRTALQGIVHSYHDHVQAILTPDQWAQYVEMEKAAREKLLLKMKEKKIIVKELDTN